MPVSAYRICPLPYHRTSCLWGNMRSANIEESGLETVEGSTKLSKSLTATPKLRDIDLLVEG